MNVWKQLKYWVTMQEQNQISDVDGMSTENFVNFRFGELLDEKQFLFTI